jgi:hypothetical protein
MDNIKYPEQEEMKVVFHLTNSKSSFVTNLKEHIEDYWKGETLEFIAPPLQGQKRKVLAYNGTTKMIYLESDVSEIPQPDSVFKLDNCWRRKPLPKWGPNIFGQTYGYKKPWATLYGFKCTKTGTFIPDPGDVDDFTKPR